MGVGRAAVANQSSVRMEQTSVLGSTKHPSLLPHLSDLVSLSSFTPPPFFFFLKCLPTKTALRQGYWWRPLCQWQVPRRGAVQNRSGVANTVRAQDLSFDGASRTIFSSLKKNTTCFFNFQFPLNIPCFTASHYCLSQSVPGEAKVITPVDGGERDVIPLSPWAGPSSSLPWSIAPCWREVPDVSLVQHPASSHCLPPPHPSKPLGGWQELTSTWATCRVREINPRETACWLTSLIRSKRVKC